MNHDFGYRWATLLHSTYWVPIAGAIVYWQQGGISTIAIVTLAVVCVFIVGRNALVLCRVQVNDQQINVRFLLPIRAGGIFRHEEIESYADAAINDNTPPFSCFLKPKNQKRLMLVDAGTKNFEELSAVLKEIYPNTKR